MEDRGSGKQPERLFSVDMDTEQDREVSKVDVRDVRDLIICKQTRYIESLQRQIDELRFAACTANQVQRYAMSGMGRVESSVNITRRSRGKGAHIANDT